MVKSVVAKVVNHIADLEGSPEEDRENRVTEFDNLPNCEVSKREDDAVYRRR